MGNKYQSSRSLLLPILLISILMLSVLVSNRITSAETNTLQPTFDTQVSASKPDSSYPNSAVIYTQKNSFNGYFRFNASSLIDADETVTKVTFQPYINHITASNPQLNIYAIGSAWNDRTTWNNSSSERLACSGTPIAQITVPSGSQRVSIDLPVSIIAPDGSVNICATSNSDTQIRIASMDDTRIPKNPPYLLVSTEKISNPADTTPPSVPTGLGATLPETGVSLYWNGSSDNVGVASYKILRNGIVIGSSTSTNYLDTTATAGTTFSYAVRAIDTSNNESNLSASVSVTTPTPPIQPSTIFRINDTSITDSSSWALSRRNEGIRWTNQDRTNQEPEMYAIGPDGRTIATVTMTGNNITHIDPEAASTAVVNGIPYVYQSDAGGNLDKRNPAYVHRFAEPALDATGSHQNLALAVDTWTFNYPEADLKSTRTMGPDSEALLVDPATGQMFIILKAETGLPTDSTSWGIYAAPLESANTPGNYNLTRISNTSLKFTDAAWSADRSEIALRTYTEIYVYKVLNGNIASALATTPLVITTPNMQQSEGISFSADGQAVELSTEEHNGGQAPVIRQPLPANYTAQPITLVSPSPNPDPEPPVEPVEIVSLGSGTLGAASTYTIPSVTLENGTTTLLYVTAGRTNGAATYPQNVSGLGGQWELVATETVGSGNLKSAIYKSHNASGSGSINVQYSASQQNFNWRLVQAGSSEAVVTQTASYSGTSSTPVATFTQVSETSDKIFGFISSNSSSQTISTGNGTTALGQANSSSNPSVRTYGGWKDGGSNNISFSAGGSNQKTIIAVVIRENTTEPEDESELLKVAVIGDSLTYQNGYGPTAITTALNQANYDSDNLYVYGAGGKAMIRPDSNGKTTIQNIADARATLGKVDTWVIALGTNDIVDNDSTYTANIRAILDAIGPNDKVVWIGLGFYGVNNTNASHFNPIIQSTLASYSNAHFSDWNAYIHNGRDESGLWAYPVDYTHMSTAGYAIRNQYYVDRVNAVTF